MPERPWTVLAYLVADDDRPTLRGQPTLNEIATAEIKAIAAAAKQTRSLVLLQADFTKGRPRRFVFDGRSASAPSMAGKPQRETNAGSLASLKSFLSWSAATAKRLGRKNTRYAVIFWGHGAGPEGLFLDPSPRTHPPLRVPALRRGLASLGRPYVDLVIFKDCWISTLEVAYELRNVVRFMIASQGIIRPMKDIWPYRSLFNAIRHDGFPSGTTHRLLRVFAHHYDQAARPVPLSALTLDAAQSLAAPLEQFTHALRRATGHARTESRKLLASSRGGDVALLDVRTACKKLRHAGLFAQQSLALERAVNTLVAGNIAAQKSGLTGVSLFHRRGDVDKSNFAVDLALPTYRKLALTKTGWANLAFEDVLG